MTDQHTPVELTSRGSGTSQVAAGYIYSLYRQADGRVFAAGRNDYLIDLVPAAPLSEVGYVYVLLSVPDPEIETLLEAARDSLTTGGG